MMTLSREWMGRWRKLKTQWRRSHQRSSCWKGSRRRSLPRLEVTKINFSFQQSYIQEIFSDEVGKIGVSVDALLDKKNLLLFHGLDLVKTKQSSPCDILVRQANTKPEKGGKSDKKVKIYCPDVYCILNDWYLKKSNRIGLGLPELQRSYGVQGNAPTNWI